MNASDMNKLAKDANNLKRTGIPPEILERIEFFARRGKFETNVYGSELDESARQQLAKLGYSIVVHNMAGATVVTIAWTSK